MVTSSEGFIAGEMDIIQAKLKKLFALDMADFQATKQSNTSSASHYIVNHLKTNQPTVTSPPTPIVCSPRVKSEGFIAGEMAKLKKLLN